MTALLWLVKLLADVFFFFPSDSHDEGAAERGQRNKRRVLGTNSVGERPRRLIFPLLLLLLLLLPLLPFFCSASKFSLLFASLCLSLPFHAFIIYEQ